MCYSKPYDFHEKTYNIIRIIVIREDINEAFKRNLWSHFLSSIAFNILMTDVRLYINDRSPQAVHAQSFRNILYADDILLIHLENSIVQGHVKSIRRINKEYDLELNNAELKTIAINS